MEASTGPNPYPYGVKFYTFTGLKSPGDPSPRVKKGKKQTSVKSGSKRGTKESLQTRVCDAVRRGFQWRRDSQSAGTKWPAALRRFRRLLSGGTSHEADNQQESEPVTSAMSTGDNPSSASQPQTQTAVDKGWPRSDEVVSGLVKHFETLRDDKPHDPGGKRPSPGRQLSLSRQHSISVDDSDGFASSTTGTTRSRSAVPSIVMELCESDDEREPKVPAAPAARPPTLPVSSNVEPSTNLMRKSPVTVQEWVDSIPASPPVDNDPDDVLAVENHVAYADDVCPTVTIRPADSSGVDGVCGVTETAAVQRRELFSREASPSLQSDTGSHTSSVDSFLDARRPDPEELLLSLGFGGSVSTDAELSRIPARFLQPSKVKGININDFLRYQQDIIDTFETGFCGYRGLTGGSQTPSGIVSKIMEKLREHERETSTKSSAASTPAGGRHRFTRAAQTVSLLSRLKTKQGEPPRQTSSVLNADNRKFLEIQSSKSPEVPRRRMILGQRSFTLDNKGDIIDYEQTPDPTPETTDSLETHTNENNQEKPPPPRPLEHKDSFMSSATSQSLTSADSDSDSDSDQPVVQRYVRSQSHQPTASGQAAPSPLPNIDENAPTEVRRKAPPLRRRSTSVDILETEGLRKRNVSGRDKGGAISPARKAVKHWQKSGSGSSLYDESPLTTPERTRSMTGSPSSVSSLSSSEAAFHGSATQRRRGSLKRQQNVVEEDEFVPMEAASGEGREELSDGERENRTLPDSGDFQDGRLDEPIAPLFRSPFIKQLSQSEPLLCSHSPECHPVPVVDNLKRLSLPVIRIWDELGPSLWRTKKCCDVTVSTNRGIRRWQSLPCELSRVRRGDLSSPGSNSDSRSNMFSSCSDESVIHVQTTDFLGGGNGDEDRRLPGSSQLNDRLRVPVSWIVAASNADSYENDLNDKSFTFEPTDLVNGNLPEPSSTVCTNMLSSLNQQNELTAVMEDANQFSHGCPGNPPRCHASTQTESFCKCGEIYLSLLQENIRLQKVVAANSSELARVGKLLETILTRGDIIKGDST